MSPDLRAVQEEAQLIHPEWPPTDLLLFHAPNSRSRIVRWALEELQISYRQVTLDLYRMHHKKPKFLAVNPLGKVPALLQGQTLVTETAAILLHLADRYHPGQLAPRIEEPERGPFLRWLIFAPASLEPPLADALLGREPAPKMGMIYGPLKGAVRALVDGLEARGGQGFAGAEGGQGFAGAEGGQGFAGVEGGPWLLGQRFTVADMLVGSMVRLGVVKGVLEAPALVAYAERLAARPAFQATEEGAVAP